MTTGLLTERDTPDCPHCGAYMDEASVSLGDLLAHWPIPRFVMTGSDGFNHDCHRYLTVDCPSCGKPSVLAIDPLQPAITAKLVAARTAKDVAYVVDQANAAKPRKSLATRIAESRISASTGVQTTHRAAPRGKGNDDA
ncbi:hypothetical protein GRZ55_11435 [Chelativorans sp. ZYF759]|nr:hypothetical protein [Chelativorans sp. ZYF759]